MLEYRYKVRNGQNKSWEDLEMIEFIISILVPILGGLGVSEADVTTYVTNCSGYIYAILISILVLIVLLVAAHFIARKGTAIAFALPRFILKPLTDIDPDSLLMAVSETPFMTIPSSLR